MTIRRPRDVEQSGLVALWERSVRASHTFLTEADIEFYRPFVADIIGGAELDLWVLADEADVSIGFMGMSQNGIEALFLEPRCRRRGGGRRLIEHAQARSGAALTVDVNEENVAARAFYEALGFTVVGRAPLDSTGRRTRSCTCGGDTAGIFRTRRDIQLAGRDPTTCVAIGGIPEESSPISQPAFRDSCAD
jgi:putative acetyltransferase